MKLAPVAKGACMNRDQRRVVGYSFGCAAAASLLVPLFGIALFGFQLTENQGRFLGAIATLAGIAGAILGMKAAFHKNRSALK
jgi:hypothetical protein